MKKLVILIPAAILLLLFFSNQATAGYMKSATSFRMESSRKLIQASDYHSPHPGKIQTSIDLYSQTTESLHEFKKIQHSIPVFAFSSKSDFFMQTELNIQNCTITSIPFYISYCTIIV